MPDQCPTEIVRLTIPIHLVSYEGHPATLRRRDGKPRPERPENRKRLTMAQTYTTGAQAPHPKSERAELMTQILGGLWPVEGVLESLLDRLETRDLGRTAQ